MLLSGCALGSGDKEVVKECILPQDQAGTLTARWKVTAVPIALQQGAFSAEETQAIVAAADTWNTFYASSLGMAAIDYGDPANPRTSTAARPANLCAGGILTGTEFKGSIVIYKYKTWPYPEAADVIAFTKTCKSAGNPLPFFFMAVMELNYQKFFSAGRKAPDLQSIVLHELGHVMGLDHSCEKSPGDKVVPNCTSAGMNQEYATASMYPVFGFDAYGLGEQKRTLNRNDQGRANCLYQDAVAQ
ncbi:MAG: hypothetical protein A2X94_07875 [Bdellovibrionales bacterium GWB1_55_8]|nr:MAG: hypothetical protein A2X94_07875 [Bdellovibrionales bacterium GWB1_55_8]